MIRIEKRLSFGFRGEWGKVYKLFTYTKETEQKTVMYQAHAYADIGQDVQFKYLPYGVDKQSNITQPMYNVVQKGEYRVVKTTDAYFNETSNNYECVVGLDDLIYLFGCWWVVDKVEEESIYTPKKHTAYYIGLKKVTEEVVTYA